MGSAASQGLFVDVFEERYLSRFEAFLKQGIDLEQKYNDTGLTLLIRAALEDDTGKFVAALLSAGANPNTTDNVGLAALHYAMIRNNVAAMHALLRDERTDVNALVTCSDNSPLHFAAQFSWDIEHIDRHLSCIALLMYDQDCVVNRPNKYGQTPISLAVEQYYGERVRVMLTAGQGKLDVDNCVMPNGRNVREVIRKRFPELVYYLPPRRVEDIDSPDGPTRLLAALQHLKIDLFTSLLKANVDKHSMVDPNYWYGDPYYSTCIELACRMLEREKYVQALLDAGADPNTVNRIHRTSLIHLTANVANYPVLETLIRTGQLQMDVTNSYNHTAIHVVAQKQCRNAEETERVQRCLALLLNPEIAKCKDGSADAACESVIDVNSQDDFGDTALHNAAHYGNKPVALTLLRHGAQIMKENIIGEPPLHFIDAATLETFLDEQLEGNGLSPQSFAYQVILKYNFLIPNEEDSNSKEMAPLEYISQSENLRHLLTHPIFSSYLYLKWHNVRKLFLINVVFYTLFVILLTTYLILINRDQFNYGTHTYCSFRNITYNMFTKEPASNDFTHNHFECINEVTNTLSSVLVVNDGMKCRQVRGSGGYEHSGDYSALFFVQLPLKVFLVAFFIREFFQFATQPREYVRSLENIVEVLLILNTGLLLSNTLLDSKFVHHISAISILLSWTELVLLTGRFPLLSLQLEMFKKVSYTFLKFMAWYSLFIVAFALSFHTLFSTGIPAEDGKETFFQDPWQSILKTVVMMTGEFEASTLMFESAPVTSHIVFLIFVFMAAIVLLKLLNGLAVYDTQAIKDDAKVLGLVSMVRTLSYMERMLTKFRYVCCSRKCQKFVDTRLMLINHTLAKKQLHVFPSNGWVKFLLDRDATRRFSNYRMDKDIVKLATEIVNNKRVTSELDELKELLILQRKNLEIIEREWKTERTQMAQVLDRLSKMEERVRRAEVGDVSSEDVAVQVDVESVQE